VLDVVQSLNGKSSVPLFKKA